MFALYEEGDGDGLVIRIDDDEAALEGVLRSGESCPSSCSDTDIVGVTGGVGRKLISLEASVFDVLVGVTMTVITSNVSQSS